MSFVLVFLAHLERLVTLFVGLCLVGEVEQGLLSDDIIAYENYITNYVPYYKSIDNWR